MRGYLHTYPRILYINYSTLYMLTTINLVFWFKVGNYFTYDEYEIFQGILFIIWGFLILIILYMSSIVMLLLIECIFHLVKIVLSKYIKIWCNMLNVWVNNLFGQLPLFGNKLIINLFHDLIFSLFIWLIFCLSLLCLWNSEYVFLCFLSSNWFLE